MNSALVSRIRASSARARRRVVGWAFTATGGVLTIGLLFGVIGVVANEASAGPPAAMTAYVPLPANDMVTAFKAINSAAGTTLDFAVGITVASDGAVVYYDHWEDGYEADISNPTQSTTQVWGDGDPSNGDASDPTVCGTACSGDILHAGSVMVLRNNVTTPHNAGSSVLYDGRDKVASTRSFALTAGGWTTAIGSLLAGVVSAFDTSRYGTSFLVPVGQDTPTPSGASPPFEYTSATIMAAQDNTTVQVDKNHDGTFDQTDTINAGQAAFVNGGLLEGARIVASKPVQVHLMAGDVGATYEGHFFTLVPTALLSNSYIDPVGSSVSNQETIIYLFNPNASSIQVTPTCTGAGCGTPITIGSNATQSFKVPLGEAVRFDSGGAVFTAVGAMGSQSGAPDPSDSITDQSSTYDWGFTLVPANILTTQVVLGWAPGASDVPVSDPNDDPVWVTTFNDTTLSVDFDGNPSTGALSGDCIGQHDLEIPVSALASTRITDTNDNQMTGARIYTCDGTPVAAAWGEDPANAPAGSPGLDAGYTVIPTATMLVNKTSTLAIDSNGDGKFGPGDTVQYEAMVSNAGGIQFTNVVMNDDLQAGMTYVPDSTVIDDGSTITPVADDSVGTPFPADGSGLGIPNVQAGATLFVRFRVQIDNPYPSSGNQLTNTVSFTSDQGSGTSTDQRTLATADLELTKTETANPQFVGQNAVFHVTVTNHGPDTAPAVEVTDQLPAGTTYQSDNPSQGSYDNTTGLWTVGDLANGASATLDITASVDTTSVRNFAEVSASGAVDPDSQPAEDPLGPGHNPNQDDEDAATVNVSPRADLSLNKVRLTGPDASGNTTYRITVDNNGPSAATGVQVTEIPPGSATFVTSSASQGSFDDTTNLWGVGTVASGANATLDITYTIPLDQFPVTNYAEVSAVNETDPDSQPAEDTLGPGNGPNQDDESSVTVTPSADLSLTKQETASPQFVGDNAVFDITVTNDGPDPAGSVQVSDPLPLGLAYVSDNPTQGSYDPSSGVWDVGTIDANSSQTLHLTARVLVAGTLTNVAEVSASGAPDPDSTPNNGDPNEDDRDTASVTTTGGSLGDTVFYDVNGDGNPDLGEPGIPGVNVTVIDAGPNGTLGDGDDITLPTVTTDSSGAWSVTGLGAGPYRVVIDPTTLPAGLDVPTYDLDGVSSANRADATLTSGQQRNDVDFGYTGSATVGDTVFLDYDGNGAPDAGEGLPNVDVTVVWAGFDGSLGTSDDISTTVTTGADGTYLVHGIPAGDVTATVDPANVPAGTTAWFDFDGGNDNTSATTIAAGVDDLNQDFGFIGTGSIGQLVFKDANHNGTAEQGEGLANVKVDITWAGPDGTFGNSDDHTWHVTTDANGLYTQGNLPAGEYTVTVVGSSLPSGATNSVDPDGGADGVSHVTLSGAETNMLQNFGYVVPAATTSTPSGSLPMTGSDAGRLMLLGLGLALSGFGLMLIGKPGWTSRLRAVLAAR